MLEKIKNGILKIKSTKKWPTCTLIACTHWDELIWYYIFEYLVNNFDIQNKILQWNLNLVIWNLKAMQGKKRFIDIDFNRIWNFKEEFKKTYEYKRAKQIKNIIANSDYVFDLHSATNPSPFFLIPEGKIDNNLLKWFDIDFIVKDILDFLHWKPLIKYVYEQNPKSKTLVMEWYIKDNTDIKKAIRNILYYLNYHWFIKYNIEDKKNPLEFVKFIEVAQKIYKGKEINGRMVFGSVLDEKLFETLQQSIKDKNLPIELLGRVDREKMQEFYNSIHFLVLTSKKDPLPTVILEAFNNGVPVIAHNIDGVPEIVEDGVNGFLYKSEDDFEAIVKKLLNVNYTCMQKLGNEVIQNKFCNNYKNRKVEKLLW